MLFELGVVLYLDSQGPTAKLSLFSPRPPNHATRLRIYLAGDIFSAEVNLICYPELIICVQYFASDIF
jgi:hypothetical protein